MQACAAPPEEFPLEREKSAKRKSRTGFPRSHQPVAVAPLGPLVISGYLAEIRVRPDSRKPRSPCSPSPLRVHRAT